MSTLRAELALDTQALLGESPCWDERTDELLWVDLEGGSLHGWHPASGQRWTTRCGPTATFVALRARGGYVIGLEHGVGVVEGPGAQPAPAIELARPGLRMNDGDCDPAGNLWVGTASTLGRSGEAALYRIEPGWRPRLVLDGVTTSNGVGWSPDGQRMYHVDSGNGCLYLHEGGRRSLFVAVERARGIPDGLTVDETGCIWLALWGAGAVERYTPAGRLDRRVAVEAPMTTSCCFGGSARDTLFITTATCAGEPGGGIYSVGPGVQGLASTPFAG